MRRRTLLRHVGALAVASAGLGAVAGCAPPLGTTSTPLPPKLRRIGWLGVRDPGPISLRRTLPELGWVEGRDFVIELRHADGDHSRLPGLASELVDLPVDILISSTVNPTRAAQRATGTIPIIFVQVGDPVSEGFVASLARPGRNVTGVVGSDIPLAGKRLELLRAMSPTMVRVGVLINTEAPEHAIALEGTRDAGRALGVEILEPVRLNRLEDLERALDELARQRADGFVDFHAPGFYGTGVNTGLTTPEFTRLLEFAEAHRLPHSFGSALHVRAGALMGLAPDLEASYRALAAVVDSLLRGADPAQIAVAMPTSYVFALNLEMARRLKLVIAPDIVKLANEVIA